MTTCSTTTQNKVASHSQPLINTQTYQKTPSWLPITPQAPNPKTICVLQQQQLAQKSESLSQPEGITRGRQQRRPCFALQLHASMPNHIPKSARELPALLDPQHITEDPFPRQICNKLIKAKPSSKRGEQNRLRQI